MNNFSLLIHKDKKHLTAGKTLLFVFMFLVVFLTFFNFRVANVKAQAGQMMGTTYANTTTPPDATCKPWPNWWQSALAWIGDLVAWGPEQVANISAELFSWVLTTVGVWHITVPTDGAAAAFIAGWISCRDLGNMLIVLGFVIVGVATTLRIREYDAKRFLGKLIIIALMINFSGLFCGLIMDASTLTMKGLLVSNDGGGTGVALFDAVQKIQKGPTGRLCQIQSAVDPSIQKYLETDALFFFLYGSIIVCCLYLAYIMIIRYAVLGILFMLSPLAFAFWAFPFPDTKKLWTRWWENFIKWAFIGVGLAFFLHMAATMTDMFKSYFVDGSDTHLEAYLSVVVFTIIVGIKIATNVGKLAATAAIGLATGGAGLAMGAIAGTAKLTGVSGMAQRVGQKTKNVVKGGLERAGLVSKGSVASDKAKRVGDSESRLKNIKDNKELANIAQQKPLTAQKSADKAAAAKILADRKAFNEISPAQRDAVAAHAMVHGISKDTFTKSSPGVLAGATDREAYNKAIEKKTNEQIATGVPKKTALNNAKTEIKNNPRLVTEAHKEIRQQRIVENALGLSPLADRDVYNDMLGKRREVYVNQGMTHRQMARQIQKDMAQIPTADFEKRKTEMTQERISNGFAKMDTKAILNAPKEILTRPEFLSNVGGKAFDNALGKMPKNHLDEAAKILDENSDEGKRAAAHRDFLTQNNKTAELKNLKENMIKVERMGDKKPK